MAAFDRESGSLVVRVVFDGPSGAGKTALLWSVARTFAPSRRGEVATPRPRGEPTAWFDWLLFSGGVVAGHPLRAQLVTTPGRSVVARRRDQIARTADVLVFVCESTPGGLRRAGRALVDLRARERASGRARPVVFVANKQDLATTSVSELVRTLGVREGEAIVPTSATRGEGIREVLVEALRAAAGVAEAELVARAGKLGNASDETELLAELDGRALLAAFRPSPPLPDEDAPSGDVWPRRRGRRALRVALAALGTARGAYAAGSLDTELRVEAGEMCLTTSRARRFASAEEARVAMLEAARGLVRGGDGETALAVVQDEAGAAWLWSIVPRTDDLAWEGVDS